MIAEIFEDRRAAESAGFGFLDNALFLARKHASHYDAAICEGIVRVLLAVSRINAAGLEAANETADEIFMQPSDAARRSASIYRERTGGMA